MYLKAANGAKNEGKVLLLTSYLVTIKLVGEMNLRWKWPYFLAAGLKVLFWFGVMEKHAVAAETATYQNFLRFNT